MQINQKNWFYCIKSNMQVNQKLWLNCMALHENCINYISMTTNSHTYGNHIEIIKILKIRNFNFDFIKNIYLLLRQYQISIGLRLIKSKLKLLS